jgi:hypothetical protein
MLNLNGIKVSEYLADLWESENEQNRLEHQDENGEVNVKDEISFLAVTNSICFKKYHVYLRNGSMVEKDVPENLKSIFETSIKRIIIDRWGYLITTDLYEVNYDYSGKIKGVEER